MDVFERLLLDVYRSSREMDPDLFQGYTLTLLRRTFNVEAAIWGSGQYDGVHVSPTHLALAEVPTEAISEAIALNACDRVTPLVVASLGRTCAFHAPTLFARPADGLLRDYAARWRRQSYLVTALVDPNPDLYQWISLYRPTPDDLFSAQQRLLCERLMPHLREALSISLALHLPAQLDSRQRSCEPLALVDPEGYFRQASAGLVEMVALEWPLWEGGRLPVELRRKLVVRGGWNLVGQRICAQGHNAGSFRVVRLRRKSTVDALSPRQSEVARLFADGLTHKEIANRLQLMPTTVRNHLAAAYRGLGINTRGELRQQIPAMANNGSARETSARQRVLE